MFIEAAHIPLIFTVATQNGKRETVMCDPATIEAGADVGFVCQDGRYIPT